MLNLLAQSVNQDAATATNVAFAGIFGSVLIIGVIIGLIYLSFLIWWIILLIDCVNRDFKDRTTWIIILIAGFLLGFIWLVDILYYFLVKEKYDRKNNHKNKK